VSNNPVVKLNEAYLEFVDGKIDRRGLLVRASALGLSAASVATFMRGVPANAQDASPAAAPSGDFSFTSIKFDEYKAQLLQAFPFEEPANTGGSVINGDSSSLTTTNLLISSDAPTNPVLNLVYETLVGSSPIDGQYVPALAEWWEIAADGRTYTFHLRQDVTWHDGTRFTADDVIFSMEAQADPATTSAYTTSFNATVESFTKVDDYTVQVVSPAVLAQVVFLGNSYCPIVPKHIWESVPHDQWSTDPGATGEDPSRVIGTGMFKFVELNSGDGLARFARNENYWDTPPVIDEFIFQVWPDDISAVEALRAGDIDFYENVPPSDTQALMDEEHLDVALYDTFSFSFYAYQMDFERFKVFEDVRTRQALAYAIDRQSIVDNISLGYAEVAQGSQPVLSVAYAPDEIRTKYTYDPEKAKQLLADAGWADADGDGVLENGDLKLSFRMTYGTGSATTDQMIAYMQEAWAAIGAEMVPDGVDFSDALLPIITGPAPSHDYETILLAFNWDATADQSAMFSTESYNGGFNFMKYSNPEVDRLNAEANQTIDPDLRRQLLIESANLVNEDLPLNIILFRKDRTAYNVRMHNYFPNALGGIFWPLQYVWVDA
jgi:peptide/nickel transport system substrate-binding protein